MSADDDATAGQLLATSNALIEANQMLARIPLLEFQIEEVWEAREWFARRNAELSEKNDELRKRLQAIENSKSWRLLAPLRQLRTLLR